MKTCTKKTCIISVQFDGESDSLVWTQKRKYHSTEPWSLSGSQEREREAQRARHVGVGDGLPQAGPLPDGGDQFDGGALQVVLDGGDDDRDDHDDQLDGGANQGHRGLGQ